MSSAHDADQSFHKLLLFLFQKLLVLYLYKDERQYVCNGSTLYFEKHVHLFPGQSFNKYEFETGAKVNMDLY